MDVGLYNEIVAIIHNHKGTTNVLTEILIEKYPSVDKDTLGSIISNEWQKITRKCHYKNPDFVNKIFNEYMEVRNKEKESSADSGSYLVANRKKIVDIGVRNRLPPTLISRIILTKFYESKESEQDDCKKLTKRNVADMLVDTNLIEDLDLSMEVYWAILYDDQYSPAVEVMKKNLGYEYERKLSKHCKSEKIAFKDERKLRQDGYDKTPDIKLEVPILIDGLGITWIESKALFGDEEVHSNYIRDQYSSYWNRWGPGLVIYWFGYVETIQTPTEKRFIIRDRFPDSSSITHLSCARPDKKTLANIQKKLSEDFCLSDKQLQTCSGSETVNDNIIDTLKIVESNFGNNSKTNDI